ncbi:hypothetical protein QE152_g22336 [Popillia japonica]|uniref:Uncharacterized protein n=1 Tax=Popillia japonica TaxID=7064 RepID=A0AAW1KJ30_POPJA
MYCIRIGVLVTSKSTVDSERSINLEVSVIRSNLISGKHVNEVAIALRTAWNTHRDIGTKITNFAHLVQKQLTDTDDEEYED